MNFFRILCIVLATGLYADADRQLKQDVPTAGRSTPEEPIPELDTRGDVYKTEGPNDPLIYDSATGDKKLIMLYLDFPDLDMTIPTTERADKVLGKGRVQEIFLRQSYGKLRLAVEHVHGWRELPKEPKTYDCTTTEGHRELFVDIFNLYPEVDFNRFDYIVANVPGRGNFAFGERDDLAIPYKGGKIRVALNVGSNNPHVLVHELGHLMGLPDLYSLGEVEGPRNPAGSWDFMSEASRSNRFLGWHRHKLKWLDTDRKRYLTGGRHSLVLAPLDAASGCSLVVVPVGDPGKPSKVFVVETAAYPEARGDTASPADGVLIYSVDATRPTGKHAVVVYPREDRDRALFHPGDTFEHDEAPMRVQVLKRLADGSFEVDIGVIGP